MAKKKNTPEKSSAPGQGSQAGQAGAKVSKKEGVRRALAELGKDATTAQIQGWVKDRQGIDMTLGHISTTRGELRRAEAGQGKAAKKPAAPKPAAAKERAQESAARTQEQPRAAAEGNGKEPGIPLKDILYVKELVGRFGAGPLHTLIDAFAR